MKRKNFSTGVPGRNVRVHMLRIPCTHAPPPSLCSLPTYPATRASYHIQTHTHSYVSLTFSELHGKLLRPGKPLYQALERREVYVHGVNIHINTHSNHYCMITFCFIQIMFISISPSFFIVFVITNLVTTYVILHWLMYHNSLYL